MAEIVSWDMTKYLVQLLLVMATVSSLHGAHMLEVIGGTGAVSARVSQQNYLAGVGTSKGEAIDPVYMRETTFLAARYTHYAADRLRGMLVGGELSLLAASPSTAGKWRFSQYDSSSNLTAQATQDFTTGSAPGLSIVRGALHVGYSLPLADVFAPELGLMAGAGFGETKYTYQSPVSSGVSGGVSSGNSGFAAHVGVRFAIKIFPADSMGIGIEYRYMLEAMGSVFSFAPGLQSSTSSASLSGHMLLLSVGFRFGLPPQRADGT